MGNDIRIRGTFDDQISSKLSKVRDRFDTLGKGAASASLAGNVGAKAMSVGFGLAANAADSAVQAIGDSIAAASDQREAMSLNAQVFKSASADIDEWSDHTAKAFGVSKTEAIDYAAKFGNSLKSAGLAADELAAKSEALTERGADLGSAFNASGEEVAVALRAGLVGEAEPLRRFGILISAATVEQKALAMGLKKTKGELTEGDKVLARYNLIMEQSADSAGMFGRDVDSLADKQKELNARWEDAQASLGEQLLPVVTDTAEGFLALFDAVAMLNGEMPETVRQGEETLVSLADLGAMLPFVGSTFKALGNVAKDNMTEVAGSVDNLKGKAQDDLYVVETALTDVGDQAEEMARVSDASADAAATAYEDMAGRAVSAAQKAIDDAFDPIIAHDRLIADNAEISAARRVLASGKASKAEIRDAKATLHSTQQDVAEQLITLAEAGETNTDAYKTGIKNLKAAIKEATGPTKVHLQAVLDKIREIERVGKVIPLKFVATFKSGTHAGGGGPQQYAEGGFVPGRKGEPQLAIVHGGEYVVSNEEQAAASRSQGVASWAPMSRGGSPIINLTYAPQNSSASVAESQAWMRNMVPELVRELRRQGVA